MKEKKYKRKRNAEGRERALTTSALRLRRPRGALELELLLGLRLRLPHRRVLRASHLVGGGGGGCGDVAKLEGLPLQFESSAFGNFYLEAQAKSIVAS
uniref:Uncharacterized protein n=1 Tax=Oryza meridionalis TaxID=40149 RepID=A0A0E0DTC1_9ORYZ